jgi:hypothetical protein
VKPTPVTPDDLFRSQRRYVIPLFQRGYVWTEQGHWAPLWRDIVLCAALHRPVWRQRAGRGPDRPGAS